jgi:enoyl-[acyl-carrier protein] reductase I
MMGVAKSALECCVRYLAMEMGPKRVRVNAISPGPIATPAAIGEMLAFQRHPAAIDTPAGRVFRRALARIESDPKLSNESELVKASALWDVIQKRIASECAIDELVTQEDVADCALFLASDLSRKISGQVIHVDCGLSSARLMPESE